MYDGLQTCIVSACLFLSHCHLKCASQNSGDFHHAFSYIQHVGDFPFALPSDVSAQCFLQHGTDYCLPQSHYQNVSCVLSMALPSLL